MAIHVDDLKLAGEPEVVKKAIARLQQVFGEMKLIWSDFTNCCVRHIQDPKTKEVTLDQIAYIAALRPITVPELKTAKNEDKCSTELTALYQSLLGAVAYATHTRVGALLCHIQFVRELLDRGVFQAMCWLDTRDMLADGLTKGCVDRSLLHQAMDGHFTFKHEVKVWTRKKGAVAQYEPPTVEGDDKELDTLYIRSSIWPDWSSCFHAA